MSPTGIGVRRAVRLGSLSLYEDLGVAPTASEADIKAAYRKAVKSAHPDGGGSSEMFARLQRAFHVLNDPSRRARYDQTGNSNEVPDLDPELLAHRLLAQMVLDFISGDLDLESTDILAIAAQALRKRRQDHDKAILRAEARVGRIQQVEKRLTSKGHSNLFSPILEQQKGLFLIAIEKERRAIIVLDRALALVDNYDYLTIYKHSLLAGLAGDDMISVSGATGLKME